MIKAGRVRTAAREGSAALGFDGMFAVAMALSISDFYTNMPNHADHRVGQDVYRPATPVGEVHLKLTVIDDVLIVSFKESCERKDGAASANFEKY